MKWVIQDNLYNERNYDTFINSLNHLKQDYTIVKVIPFAHELLPDMDFDPNEKILVMGSDSLIKVAQKKKWFPGAFTNNNFDYRIWQEVYGNELLNSDAETKRFGDIVPSPDPFFIRPVFDFKLFAGFVVTQENFLSWQEKAVAYGDTLNADTLVIVSSPKHITQEYRFFIAESKIITASSYKVGDRVIACDVVEDDVIEYTQKMINIWTPDIAYVMDVARTSNGFKIIEFNCINASGYYAADVHKLVSTLSKLVDKLNIV